MRLTQPRWQCCSVRPIAIGHDSGWLTRVYCACRYRLSESFLHCCLQCIEDLAKSCDFTRGVCSVIYADDILFLSPAVNVSLTR